MKKNKRVNNDNEIDELHLPEIQTLRLPVTEFCITYSQVKFQVSFEEANKSLLSHPLKLHV